MKAGIWTGLLVAVTSCSGDEQTGIVTVAPGSMDLGDAPEGGTQEVRFAVENGLGKGIQLYSFETSCGCQELRLGDAVVSPEFTHDLARGEKAVFSLTVSVPKGRWSGSVRLRTTDSRSQLMTFFVSGRGIPVFALDPPEIVLGRLLKGELRRFSVKVSASDGEEFGVGESAGLTVLQVSSSEYLISGSFRAESEGTVNTVYEVETSRGMPIKIPVIGTVPPDVEIVPRVLYLGACEVGGDLNGTLEIIRNTEKASSATFRARVRAAGLIGEKASVDVSENRALAISVSNLSRPGFVRGVVELESEALATPLEIPYNGLVRERARK